MIVIDEQTRIFRMSKWVSVCHFKILINMVFWSSVRIDHSAALHLTVRRRLMRPLEETYVYTKNSHSSPHARIRRFVMWTLMLSFIATPAEDEPLPDTIWPVCTCGRHIRIAPPMNGEIWSRPTACASPHAVSPCSDILDKATASPRGLSCVPQMTYRAYGGMLSASKRPTTKLNR